MAQTQYIDDVRIGVIDSESPRSPKPVKNTRDQIELIASNMAIQQAFTDIDFPKIAIDSNRDTWPEVKSPAFKARDSPSLKWMSQNAEM